MGGRLVTEYQQQCVKHRIYGKVQSVGFRYSTWGEAKRLGLTGYVRNLYDGSVEILACGTPEQLEKLLLWINAGGPGSARVDNVFSTACQPEQTWTQFSVHY